MEPLAFVEVLGRHNDVQARHAVYRWPAKVGRGYDAAVILDDRFVAAHHLSIEPAEDGRFRLTELQSLNGLTLQNSSTRVADAMVGPDDVVRLGRTQIRIRAPSYQIQPEQRLRAASLYRRPGAFACAAAVLLALTLWSAWIATTTRDEWASLFFPVVVMCVVVGLWISVWALVSRTVGGRANFAAHGFVACAALVAITIVGTLFEYLAFGFDARWLARYAGTALLGALGAYMLYRHLRLNSRAPRRTLGIVAGIVVAAVFGVAVGLQQATATMREGALGYDNTLKSPVFLWAQGVTPEDFIAESEKLRRKSDAAARVPD